MISLLVLTILSLVTVVSIRRRRPAIDRQLSLANTKIERLWNLSHRSVRENKLLQAERVLLTILRMDQKNAAAYNRIGILYAKQKEYKDAINCFEIACTLDRSAGSFHNLGMVYFDTEDYDKASLAFKRALELDNKPAIRYVSYAKVLQKQKRYKEMFDALEKAVKLEPNNRDVLLLLQTSYQEHDQPDKAAGLQGQIDRLIITNRSRRSKRTVV